MLIVSCTAKIIIVAATTMTRRMPIQQHVLICIYQKIGIRRRSNALIVRRAVDTDDLDSSDHFAPLQ